MIKKWDKWESVGLFVTALIALLIVLSFFRMNQTDTTKENANEETVEYRLRAGIIEELSVQVEESVKKEKKEHEITKAAPKEIVEPADLVIDGKIEDEKHVFADVSKMESNVPNHEKKCKSYVKTHMGYKSITCKTSKQYALQQTAYTDTKTGIRMVDDCYMVAVGSYYTDHVGEKLLVTMSSGKQAVCIVGEFKSNRHTDPSNRYHVGGYEKGIYYKGDGSVLEFIVDSNIYSSEKIPEVFDGEIYRIEKLEV